MGFWDFGLWDFGLGLDNFYEVFIALEATNQLISRGNLGSVIALD